MEFICILDAQLSIELSTADSVSFYITRVLAVIYHITATTGAVSYYQTEMDYSSAMKNGERRVTEISASKKFPETPLATYVTLKYLPNPLCSKRTWQ